MGAHLETVRGDETMTKPPNADRPPAVDNQYLYWGSPPPELSPRVKWWMERIIVNGWRPNRHIRGYGYDSAAGWYGVYVWEYQKVIRPLLNLVDTVS